MKPFEPAPPAKDMEVRLKHNEFRDLVNELRDTADRYGGTDQLRDQLAHTLARRVRPVPEIVKMRPVLERIDARLACDVLSASSTVEVLRLARDEIMVLADEVMELRAALQHKADCEEAAKTEGEALRAELAGLRSSMEFRTSLIGRTEAERDALRALVVMRFDRDRPPQFTQGYDTHELTEPVTAEHCRWFVDEIERLRAKLEAAEKSDAESLAMYRRAMDEREALRTKAETAENDAAHQKALADSALRVAEGWERKCGEMRAALQHETDCMEAAEAKIEALRNKIEAMETQEPVAEWLPLDSGEDTRRD